MRVIFSFFLVLSNLLLWVPCKALPAALPQAEGGDSVDIQVLYNGRAWRNLYYRIKGDQFLYVNEFLPGEVTIEGKTFQNQLLKYDIYNDELIIMTNKGIVLQLNKEMISRFALLYNDNLFQFKQIEPDSVNSLEGYVNVLYDGNVSLYVKYRKEILTLAVENKYDLFNELIRVYVRKDGIIFRVDSKQDLLRVFEDKKQLLRSFIRTSHIRVSRKNPDSFRPVVEYYSNLRQ